MTRRDDAIKAAGLALHCDACTNDGHDGCDTSDWDREAEVALVAALALLQPVVPSTARPLHPCASSASFSVRKVGEAMSIKVYCCRLDAGMEKNGYLAICAPRLHGVALM